MAYGMRPLLPAGEARRFRTGRDCLDFAHTGGDGEFAVWELLHDGDDLARWLGYVVGAEIEADDAGVWRALRLRAAIWSSARRLAAGERLARADVEAIDAAAGRPALVPRLATDGSIEFEGPASPEQALSTLARDAIDLFGGPLARRIRVCAAEDCELLFVDTSRPGRRRWCSMERCGNLAKKRALRAREKEAER